MRFSIRPRTGLRAPLAGALGGTLCERRRGGGLARLFLLVLLAFAALASFVAPARAEPTEIRVGVMILSVYDVRPADGSYAVSGYAWFVDPSETFDPTRDIDILARSSTMEVQAQIDLPEGGRYWAVSFRAVVDHVYDIRRYPFDQQVLRLRFEAERSVATWRLVPDLEDSGISPFFDAPSWTLDSLSMEETVDAYGVGLPNRQDRLSFSQIVVSLDLARKLSPFLFEKFTGFFVALAITLLVLFVPTEEFGTRVGMTTGSIFAAVINRYRLEDAIGFDAAIGAVDAVTFITFSAIICMLCLSLAAHWAIRLRGARIANRLNFSVGALVVVAHAALLLMVFRHALS